jgi:hypothetical protein
MILIVDLTKYKLKLIQLSTIGHIKLKVGLILKSRKNYYNDLLKSIQEKMSKKYTDIAKF